MERPKYRYHLAFQCTKNGHFRSNMTYYVSASSEAKAKRQVKEIYPDAKAFRIIGKWENTDKKTNKPKEMKKEENVALKATEANNAERKYTGAYINAYEELIYTTWKKRKAVMLPLQKELELQYSKKLSKMKNTYEADRRKLNEEWDLTEKALEEKTVDLEKIGFFQFKEKKYRKTEIANLKERQLSISRNLQNLVEKFDAQVTTLEQEQALAQNSLYQEAKRRVPTTNIKPTNEQEARCNWMTYILLEMEPGKRYTMADLHDFPEMRHLNISSVSSTFRLPAAILNTKRTVEQGRAYYTLHLPDDKREK